MDPGSLEELNHEVRDLNYLTRKLDKTADNLMRVIGQLSTAYIFCGTLFLHSIIQPNLALQKRLWWIPFCIFLMIAIIFWLTVANTMLRFFRVRAEHYLTLKFLQMSRISNVPGEATWQNMELPKVTVSHRLKENANFFLVLLTLLAFTALILYACFIIPQKDRS